jgi:hypothetical protein
MMDGFECWCRVRVIGPVGSELASWELGGHGAPDIGVLDTVARLALAAGRLGGAVVVVEPAPALRALLELAGLPVEMEG